MDQPRRGIWMEWGIDGSLDVNELGDRKLVIDDWLLVIDY